MTSALDLETNREEKFVTGVSSTIARSAERLDTHLMDECLTGRCTSMHENDGKPFI